MVNFLDSSDSSILFQSSSSSSPHHQRYPLSQKESWERDSRIDSINPPVDNEMLLILQQRTSHFVRLFCKAVDNHIGQDDTGRRQSSAHLFRNSKNIYQTSKIIQETHGWLSKYQNTYHRIIDINASSFVGHKACDVFVPDRYRRYQKQTGFSAARLPACSQSKGRIILTNR